MARPACPEDPGVALHLVQRGCALERLDYLERLRLTAGSTGCSVHAYALMGSHVHLLATPARRSAASRMMLELGVPVDAVDATPVIAARYLLACMRYIELNPVRAGLVDRPSAYRWSSHRANAMGLADPVLTPHAIYCALGRTPAERRAAYRATFRALPGTLRSRAR
ncbi:MAG: transposase [Proteobacteria bacterium]|nr:transposase [Pseudomonadota bacterium]